MLVFWQKGYRGTSLDDLTEAMSINRPSLYAAFGDKEKLFISAIDRYRAQYLAEPTRKLLRAESLREGLPRFFRDMGEVIMSDRTPPGCMIACLLSEECCDSKTIQKKLSECISLADSTFQEVFERHKDELSERISPAVAAKLLTTTLHGMAIRARSGASKRDIIQIARGVRKSLLG